MNIELKTTITITCCNNDERFLACTKINAEAQKVMLHAPLRVQKTFSRIMDSKCPIQNAYKTDGGLTALGSPLLIYLNEDEVQAMSVIVAPAMAIVQKFSRAICNGFLLTDADYASQKKRNNSVVHDGDNIYQILKIIVGKFTCSCGHTDCECWKDALLICRPYRVIPSTAYSLSVVHHIPLHSKWFKVEELDEVVCLKPENVRGKCVLVQSESTSYVVKLPQFELD